MIIQSSDRAVLRIYECGVCRNTFDEQFDHAQAAHLQAATYGAHRHQAGACCHLGEIEINMPSLMAITLLIEKNVRTK
jgi:hypothetical protein